ncbi:MAG: hypothetical protein PHU63_01935 [Candidatus ainarchaeum sp.]|nr:hypothetical protein [Candidatus ainarchaeum sp.]
MKIDNKFLLRVGIALLLLFSLYLAGAGIEFLLLFGLIYLVIILLREKMDNLLKNKLEKYFPNFDKWPLWSKSIIRVLIIILAYFIIKQILFFGLSLLGFDLQKILLDSLGVEYDS